MLEDADGYLSDRLIPRINNTYSPFSEGYLVCLDYRGVSAETLAYHEQEERYVIFDRSGNEVGTLPEGVWPGGDIGFHGGLLMIRGEVNQTGFSAIGGAVNTQGELVFEPGSLGYRPSECGLAVLSAGAGSDTVDFDGNVVIPRDATLPNGLRLEVVHPTPSELRISVMMASLWAQPAGIMVLSMLIMCSRRMTVCTPAARRFCTGLKTSPRPTLRPRPSRQAIPVELGSGKRQYRRRGGHCARDPAVGLHTGHDAC